MVNPDAHGSDDQAGRPASPVPAAAAAPTAPTGLVELSDLIVRSLYSIGLSLAATQDLVSDRAARDHLAAAVEELDRTLSTIRNAVLDC